jgi:hypothetical protein
MEKIIGMSNATFLDGCALSGLHSLRSCFLILTSCTVGLALVAFVFVSGQVPNNFIKTGEPNAPQRRNKEA